MSITITNSVSGTPAFQINAFAGGTITFSNLNGGVNFPAGTVVVFLEVDQPITPVSPLIGGNTANAIVAPAGNPAATLTMYYADVSAGTADNFTFTNGSDYNIISCIAWQLVGAATGGPSSNVSDVYPGGGSNPQTFPAITNPSGGVILVGGFTKLTGGATPVWTNCTASAGDMTTSDATTAQIMGAHSINSGSVTITNNTSGVGFAFGGIAAAWAPFVADILQPQIWM